MRETTNFPKMPADPPIRLLLSGRLSFGPGKAELLEKIAATGSIQAAASAMDMSYMKAWKMTKALNSRFREPLVVLHRGGREQGGAALTATGEKVLSLYRESVARAVEATEEQIDVLRGMLAPER